jgi:hypothetical protein
MSTIVEQYAEFVSQTQAAATAAYETWTKSVQDAFAVVPATVAPADVTEAVDEIYAYFGKVLVTQRDFVKTVISTMNEAAETAQASVNEATSYGLRAA